MSCVVRVDVIRVRQKDINSAVGVVWLSLDGVVGRRRRSRRRRRREEEEEEGEGEACKADAMALGDSNQMKQARAAHSSALARVGVVVVGGGSRGGNAVDVIAGGNAISSGVNRLGEGGGM